MVHSPVGVDIFSFLARPTQCLVKWVPGVPLNWVLRQPGHEADHIAVPGANF